MISLYLLGRLLYRGHSALNAIGLAALILLLSRPAWLFESGFQLSFSAALLIAGLVAPILERTTEPYRSALGKLEDKTLDARLVPKQAQFRLDLRALIAGLRRRSRFLGRHGAISSALVTGPARLILWTANILLFSTLLQVGLLLPMAKTFHRVAFAGISLNALAVPLMTLLLAVALPTVFLGALLPALVHWPAKVLSMVMAGLFSLTDLPHLPAWLSFRVPDPPLWVSCGFVLSILLAAVALATGTGTPPGDPKPPGGGPWNAPTVWAFRLSVAVLALMTGLIALYPFAPRLPSGILEVTALDCGQGNSLLLVFPDRTTMLVDTGGSRNRTTGEDAFQARRWDSGEDIVSPYLWSRGIKKIDIVVLSQPAEEHRAILRNFEVGEFWQGANAATPAYLELPELVTQKHMVQRTLAAGDEFERGGVAVRALWPRRTRRLGESPANDDLLILRLSRQGASVLLSGDISADVEQELLASGEPLESQVLKSAHHHSRSITSREFLARVNPRVAIFNGRSDDLGNVPSPEMMEWFAERGVRVIRPDVDGATTVQMSEGSLVMRQGRPGL
jgi:competence protein ComEC